MRSIRSKDLVGKGSDSYHIVQNDKTQFLFPVIHCHCEHSGCNCPITQTVLGGIFAEGVKPLPYLNSCHCERSEAI